MSAMVVSVRLRQFSFGLPVAEVVDVIRLGAITSVPLAPDWVAGVVNLRGRIVTAIDLARRLGLPDAEVPAVRPMSVVVQVAGEEYALIVDSVGDVIAVDESLLEPVPTTLAAEAKRVSTGVLRRDDCLLLLVDTPRLLAAGAARLAA